MKLRSSALRFILPVVAVLTSTAVASRASAQGTPVFAPPVILDSFENPDGIARWIPTADAIFIRAEQSTTGATHGTNSMLLELDGHNGQFGDWGSLAGWGVQGDFTPTDAAGYAAWQAAAANPAAWNLQFDVTTNADSWTNAPPASTDPFNVGGSTTVIQVGFSYQDEFGTGAFGQIRGQNLYGIVGKNTFSVPLSSLQNPANPIATNSGYYSVLIGADNRFFQDPPGGAKLYIDKVRLTPAKPQVATRLFSWETPDNPATPDINESREGWSDAGLNQPTASSPGDAYAHRHSVTTYTVPAPNGNPGTVFPTHGTHSLKIDTTTQDPAYDNPLHLPQSYGFRWGTRYTLNADTDPDPNVTTLDPAIKAKITDLAGKLNGADFIQFDLVVSDPFADPDPNGLGFFQGGNTAGIPNFLGITLSIQDSRGTFFQADNPKVLGGGEIGNMIINNPDALEPLKISVPMSAFVNVSGNAENRASFPDLKSTPIPLDSNSLSINLALNFGTGPVVAHIDNFRVLTPISLDADFNHDGTVNGADLTIWRSNLSATNTNGDADVDGDTDGTDFLMWQRQLGNSGIGGSLGAAAVPEPASVALAGVGLAAAFALRRRGR